MSDSHSVSDWLRVLLTRLEQDMLIPLQTLQAQLIQRGNTVHFMADVPKADSNFKCNGLLKFLFSQRLT